MGSRLRAVAGAAVLALVATVVTASLPLTADNTSRVTIRDTDGGALLASAPLSEGSIVALRYRNSLYGSLAEERFNVAADGTLQLERLAADELAVLEEYYAIDTPAWRTAGDDRRVWLADPAEPLSLQELTIAATDLGERTLIVDGKQPISLWKLEGADPTVVIQVED